MARRRISLARTSPILWRPILSAAMMLRFSLNKAEQAYRIDNEIKKVLAQGLRTADIHKPGTIKVSTSERSAAVVKSLV